MQASAEAIASAFAQATDGDSDVTAEVQADAIAAAIAKALATGDVSVSAQNGLPQLICIMAVLQPASCSMSLLLQPQSSMCNQAHWSD